MSARLACLAALLASSAAFAAPRDELAAALRARHPELTRVVLTPLARVPAGELEIPAELALDKRLRTWVRAPGEDGRPHRHVQWWALEAYAPVLVARRALRAGRPVAPADFAAEERDIAGAQATLLRRDPGVASGRWRATRYVAAGAALRRADLEPAPAVLRGEEVRVSLVAARFTIETTGVARDEGRVGAVIAVMRRGSAEPYFAEVVGDREVLIREKP